MDTDIVVALIALITSAVAAFITVLSHRNIKFLEQKMKRQEDSSQFLAEKLIKFYLPMTMHLAVNKNLFNRYFKADTDEKIAIEREMRAAHNAKVIDCLMSSSIYLEKDMPEGMADELLEHLIRWELVYKLKYEHEVYNGPVFAGIEKFGFRGFPDMDVDGYFKRKVNELKGQYHRRFKEGM